MEHGLARVEAVASENNVSDCLTKALVRVALSKQKLGMNMSSW